MSFNKNDIQMVDLKGQYLKIKDQVNRGIQDVIDSGSFINGSAVAQFTSELSGYTKSKYVIPCGNGTDALQIAMMTLDLEIGDEVILPVHTYVATAEVIALLKLVPIFVDVDPETFLIDIEEVKKKISKKTKAIVPVHLYGQCADMESLIQLAKKHHIFIVEDTAQAFGADYFFSDGSIKKAGTMGNIGCTSFFPSKNLGCYGDGGAIFINDEKLALRAKMIANHGQSKKYHHDLVGCNSRLDSLQAAILSVKLPHLDSYNFDRLQVANKYDVAFKDVEQLQIPVRASNSSHVFHQYTLRVEGVDRDALKDRLSKHGVPSMIYYPIPLHLQRAYFDENQPKGTFPVTEKLSEVVLSLPIHTEMNNEEQEYIINTVLDSVGAL